MLYQPNLSYSSNRITPDSSNCNDLIILTLPIARSAFQLTGCPQIGPEPQTKKVDSYKKNVDGTSSFWSIFGAYGIPLMAGSRTHKTLQVLNYRIRYRIRYCIRYRLEDIVYEIVSKYCIRYRKQYHSLPPPPCLLGTIRPTGKLGESSLCNRIVTSDLNVEQYFAG